MALCEAKTTLKGILWVLNLDVLTSSSGKEGAVYITGKGMWRKEQTE